MSVKPVLRRIISVILVAVIASSVLLLDAFAASAEDESYKASLRSAGFPEIYVEKLLSVHKLHPKWKFVAKPTGLDWDAAVRGEYAPNKNAVYIEPNSSYCATRLYRDMSVGSYIAKGGFDYDYVVRDGRDDLQKGWIDATPMAIAYYMNPYTFIGNDVTILQFESLEWNFADVSAAEPIIETMLTGTFMSKTQNSNSGNYIDTSGNISYINTEGKAVATDTTYANAICQAAKENNINPCYLTSKILGEIGTGGSGSVTGTVTDYTGYYNYLNIGAYNSGSGGAIYNGLAHAKTQGWDSPMKAISGGAKFIAQAYIAVGQNTAYLQKFNVTSKNTYSHQYMSALNGVVNTTYSTYSGYKKSNVLDTEKTFYIPIFNNMSASLSDRITTSGYTNTASTISTMNIRQNAGIDYKVVGSVASGQKVTIYGGFRDQRVTYDSAFGTDSVRYRMMQPLWYKIGDGRFVVEDYTNTEAATTIKIGGTDKFKYSLSNGSEKPRFMSQDTRIATVDANGNIVAKALGTTKVVAYLLNGSFAVINVNVIPDGNTPTQVSSPTYAVNNSSSLLSKIPAGTSVGTFVNGINEKAYIKVFKSGKEMGSLEVLTTGCVVSIMVGSTTVRSYTTVVTGDIGQGSALGDGKVTISDLLAIRDELLSSSGYLSTINQKAADVNGDGKVSISDLLGIRDYLLGISGITPRAL